MANQAFDIDQVIEFDGDTWVVGGVGVEIDGQTWLHLWSKTRTLLTQRNGGKVPVQSICLVPNEVGNAER